MADAAHGSGLGEVLLRGAWLVETQRKRRVEFLRGEENAEKKKADKNMIGRRLENHETTALEKNCSNN